MTNICISQCLSRIIVLNHQFGNDYDVDKILKDEGHYTIEELLIIFRNTLINLNKDSTSKSQIDLYDHLISECERWVVDDTSIIYEQTIE